MANYVTLPEIEKNIQEFIFERTGEKSTSTWVKRGKVIIETVSPHGSTILGIFWVKVFQHPNNYPVSKYPYRQLYKAAGKYLVSLRVDTVTVTVCLAKGKVTVGGTLALDWFVLRFKNIMNVYKNPPTESGQELKEPFDAEQRLYIKNVKEKIHRQNLENWPKAVIEKT